MSTLLCAKLNCTLLSDSPHVYVVNVMGFSLCLPHSITLRNLPYSFLDPERVWVWLTTDIVNIYPTEAVDG